MKLCALLLLVAAATPSKMSESIGPAATAIVREPKRVEAGTLKVIGAAKADAQRFQKPSLVAGYPVKAALKELSPADAHTLSDLVLNDQSYAAGEAVRCANKDFLGARFTVDDAQVEFALGRPCAQAFFVFRTENGIVSNGGRMTQEAASAIANIIAPKP